MQSYVIHLSRGYLYMYRGRWLDNRLHYKDASRGGSIGENELAEDGVIEGGPDLEVWVTVVQSHGHMSADVNVLDDGGGDWGGLGFSKGVGSVGARGGRQRVVGHWKAAE